MNIDKKILLVGGAGFLGNSLAEYFSKQKRPTMVVDTKRRIENYAIQHSGVEYQEIDWSNLADCPALSRASQVIHLAWTSTPSSSMDKIADDVTDNILGTLRLLDEVSKYPIDKFMFISSGGTVYGNSSNDKLSEDSATNPISSYGISKLAVENYVSLYAKKYGYTSINVRLGNPYGAYQLAGTPVGVIANFVRKIVNLEPIDIYGNGESVRDYIHIDDVLKSISELLSSTEASGNYNLGSGVGTSIAEIISLIQAETGKPVTRNNLETRRSDVRSIVLSVEKLASCINHTPSVDLKSGIKDMVDKYNQLVQVEVQSDVA